MTIEASVGKARHLNSWRFPMKLPSQPDPELQERLAKDPRKKGWNFSLKAHFSARKMRPMKLGHG